ncbi:MAG: MFS transporter [Boseongicola sp.]|nr:MFS transporter [Boseongicola sp.]NNJ69269.1 MFS transporter [Boseongicola sp.]
MARNIAVYPWFKFFQNLLFWQAVWFLFFQDVLSASQAVILYAVYDLATTIAEVPSGYFSDRIGRRFTLLISALSAVGAAFLLLFGASFEAFILAQILWGISAAFVSGTDSSILYESLAAMDRSDEVEVQELRAWRFSFTGLAASAMTGGAMSLVAYDLAFAATAVAMISWAICAFLMAEPPRERGPSASEALRFIHLKEAFTNPILIWLFVLSTLMYGFSHIPFVFGQPFIFEALAARGWSGEAPLVSGFVSTVMMLVSVAASWLVPPLRKRIGLAAILLFAMSIQVGLVGVLAVTNSVLAIAFLFLRMVPSSIHGPLLIARVQPILNDDSRATYLSIKSLVGRLMFAASLWIAAAATTDVGLMSYPEIQAVLGWYFAIGLLAFCALAVLARRIPIEPAGSVMAADVKEG